MTDGEVYIICQVDSIHLPDLGLRLTRGARASVSMSAAMRSRDLSKAKMDGTVSTQTLRSSVIRAQEHVSSDTSTSVSPRAPSWAGDINPLIAALQTLTEEIRGLRADLSSRPVSSPPASPVPDLGPLIRALTGIPQTGGGAREQAAPLPLPEEVFIPSNLTGGDLSASLNVSSENTDDPSLADTMRALKAARKKR